MESYDHPKVSNLTNLCKQIVKHGQAAIVREQTLLNATEDRMLWRAMIAHDLKKNDI